MQFDCDRSVLNLIHNRVLLDNAPFLFSRLEPTRLFPRIIYPLDLILEVG